MHSKQTCQQIICQYYSVIYSNFDSIVQRQVQFENNIIMRVLNEISLKIPQLLQNMPYYDLETIISLQEISTLFKCKYDTIIVIGMGGALLNSKAIYGFGKQQNGIKFIFISEICPADILDIQESINCTKTGFIFISNAGNTIEVVASAEYWHNAFSQLYDGNFAEHAVFVYSANESLPSLLQQLHQKVGGFFIQYDTCMGGRFSTFTRQNLLISMIGDMDVKGFLQGANTVLRDFFLPNTATQTCILYGAINLAESNVLAINCSYDSRLQGMVHWYCTALAESLGKDGTNILPFKIALPLDQHGLMQAILSNNSKQYMNIFDININSEFDDTFSKIIQIQQMMQAEILTQLQHNNIQFKRITLHDNSMEGFGGLMMHLILETITAAVLLGVEPFNQPRIDNLKRNLAIQYNHKYDVP